jgi:hypothetical protein
MATNLSQFISQIKEGGLARQNSFSINITPPQGMSSMYREIGIVHMFCEQAVLPGIAMSTQVVKTYGENREIVFDRTFENVTLTFLVDSKMLVKKFFDEWVDIIIDPITRLAGYYDQYATKINILTHNVADDITYECELREAYPKSIQVINLDSNSKDVIKLSVVFAYKNHYNRNWAISGGDQRFTQTFGNTLTNANDYGLSLQQYTSAISMDSLTNELYYSNFEEYQRQLNDSLSISKSISRLERSGFDTSLGGMFL